MQCNHQHPAKANDGASGKAESGVRKATNGNDEKEAATAKNPQKVDVDDCSKRFKF
jgi:D-lyxose ketol-isomerase